LTDRTFKLKVFVSVAPPPSVMTIAITVEPFWFVAGVRVKTRLVPVPEKTRLLLDTRSVSLEVAATVRFAAGVSMSEMENDQFVAEAFSLMV